MTRLLSDIHYILDEEMQLARNYCLQPIVVRRSSYQFDLIDGQQRLDLINRTMADYLEYRDSAYYYKHDKARKGAGAAI